MTSQLTKLSLQFNKFAASKVYENKFSSTDPKTTQDLSMAQKDNFFAGMSTGINYITNGTNDGLKNRNPNYKELAFFEKNGFYPDSQMEWIA